MRYFVLGFTLTLSTLALSQSASMAPGSYADAFAPRASTPSYSIPTPALQVGASNATEGNRAGASNMIGVATPASSSGAPVQVSNAPAFNTGASMPQAAFGTAELASQRGTRKPAVRRFTNADVEQLHSAEAK